MAGAGRSRRLTSPSRGRPPATGVAPAIAGPAAPTSSRGPWTRTAPRGSPCGSMYPYPKAGPKDRRTRGTRRGAGRGRRDPSSARRGSTCRWSIRSCSRSRTIAAVAMATRSHLTPPGSRPEDLQHAREPITARAATFTAGGLR